MNKKLLKQIIRENSVGQSDAGIEARLNQVFLLKSSQYPVHQNSFAGFLGWLFSVKGIGVKTAMISLLAAFLLFHPEVNIAPRSTSTLDSTRVSQSMVIDSALFQGTAKTDNDSVF